MRNNIIDRTVTSVSLPRDIYLKIKVNKINLSRLVENFLRTYFDENLEEQELIRQIEETKLKLAVLEEKRKNFSENKKKRGELETYMKIFIGKRETTPEFMVRKEYKGAVELGYAGSWEEFCSDIGRKNNE